jgi:hypothetical protein
VANAKIVSIGEVPGIQVYAMSLCVDQDLIIEGKIRDISMTMAVIAGHLQAKECSVSSAKLDGTRVRGDVALPKHIFGPLSLVGGRVEGAVLLKEIRLHVRRRPTGQTKPSIDFNDTQIEGDLKVEELVRVPETGVLEEVGATPPWLNTVLDTLDVPGRNLILRHATSFYEGAQVVELHVPSDDQLAGIESPIEVDCHAFLLLADGRTVYLNGQSQPIHMVNATKADKPVLRLDTGEQALDYLRFFCGYVWGEEGAFIIVDSVQDSDWLHYLERDDNLLATAPVRPQAQREGDFWVCQAVVMYGDQLFIAVFRIASSGMVEMDSEVSVARLEPEGVQYVRPYRRYWLARMEEAPSEQPTGTLPVHHTPHKVVCDTNWQPESDTDARTAIVDRIRAELTENRKEQVAVLDEVRVEIDLRGCRCGSWMTIVGKAGVQGLR